MVRVLLRARLLATALFVMLAVGCAGDTGRVEWRDLALDLPEGWVEFENDPTRLSIANAALGQDAEQDPEEIEDGVVAMFFTHEPGTGPQDWRDFVEGREEATIESDEAIHLGDVPATRIVFSHRSLEVPTREMVVVVPAREIVVLAQPVPQPGDTDAPEVFMDQMETFMSVLDSVEWGAPIE